MLYSSSASAYWLWTPETKKFVNPKYAVKDSPKEQFDWAMSFYTAKDYVRAAAEFEKLVKHYEYSEYASDAQYYIGLSYENMAKFYTAFQNYQKAIDNFPYIENLDEIIAREFNIANFYATKDNPKVLGMDIMTALDRAIEIYKKVVDNAPYGKLADEAQFKMGEALKKAERYDEAIQAFQKLVDDYPNSKFFEKAKYEAAHSAYKASLKPAYDTESTDKAIKAFQDFNETNQDKELSKEADKTVQRLKDRTAEKSLMTARFYESQKHYEAAIIYYQEVVNKFPDCSFVNEARSKIEKLSAILNGKAKAKEGEGVSKVWNPIKFTKPAKPAEPPATPKEETKNTKKSWSPFSFTKPAKNQTAENKEAPKVVKAKAWNPLSFMGQPKPKKVSTPTVASDNSSVKKSWTPLSFTKPVKNQTGENKKEPKPIRLKGWTPLNFAGQPKLKETKIDANVNSKEPEVKEVKPADNLEESKSKGE